MSFTMYVCQYPCNPTGINNDHNSGKGNQKSQRWYEKTVLQNEREKTGEKFC